MDNISNMILYFNIFKETAANNIGIMHGFSNWTNKMSYTIDGKDLLIKIPPVLIRNGTYKKISHSKRKKEIDTYMGKQGYTYLEFIMKKATDLYAQTKDKTVVSLNKKKIPK